MNVRMDLGTGWTFEIVSNAAGNKWLAVRGQERLEGSGLFL